MSKTEKTKKKKMTIIGIGSILIIIIILGAILAVKFTNDKDKNADNTLDAKEAVAQNKPEKTLNIVDIDSPSRPYAVMINNNHDAWPQCGVQDAYIVYEIIAEGGITRMMALYKDQDTAKIGSIRSARHYFLDYANENDAIFVHWGGSPQAYNKLGSIDSLDGIALEGSVFFRDKTLKRAYEHTGFTSIENVKEYAEKHGYTRSTNKDLLLNYSVDEIEMTNIENAEAANEVKIRYSDYHTTSYEYDEENKVYKRSMSGKANVDLATGEQYTAKNIIIYKIRNYTLNDGEGKGRQELDNIGSGEGYFVTGGYVIPITWEKSSHSEQTVYKYENGEELKVNDGNTFIQICPTNAQIDIEGDVNE